MVQFGNIPTTLRKKGLEAKLLKVCRDNDVVFMGIFGSYVRGEQKRGSDVDIAIRYRKGSRKSLFDLVELQIAFKVKQVMDIPFDKCMIIPIGGC